MGTKLKVKSLLRDVHWELNLIKKLISKLEGIMEIISYQRLVYESVDDRSLSQVIISEIDGKHISCSRE